ncbi:iron-sulfur cluster biosynthesis family protein [Ligilactobacillus apodemi]|uniref:iron-sulfur cluster biosynthesis family protein n=1 Tax=Ligilactobacillus apodemi TaxID=307126 RepID=UPI00214C0273|nr:iron-sulfur cluster biosynthesis family protein [Ligilactobacillus apodemi]MCR1900786.1 iron-sulfur cluster biosynthesis family protein [Ligilactobacillus apodemi]
MKLTIDNEAQAKLTDYFTDDNAVVLLDFDDGVGPFSKVGVCSLNQAFQLVIVDKTEDLHDYEEKLTTNMGDVYFKGYSDMYLDQVMQIKLNPQNMTLRLVGNSSGDLTPVLNVVDLRKVNN